MPEDWALIRISPPVRAASPIPVLSLTIDGMLDRIRSGARLVTLGYGNGAYDTAIEHDDCHLISHQALGFRPDDRWLPLGCWIRVGDSGGGVLLIDKNGRPQMIGILTGFTTKAMKVPGPMAFGTNAGNFAPYVDLPVAGNRAVADAPVSRDRPAAHGLTPRIDSWHRAVYSLRRELPDAPESTLRHPVRTGPDRAEDGEEPLLPGAALHRHGLRPTTQRRPAPGDQGRRWLGCRQHRILLHALVER